jgi:DNA polymerase III sliding clamp (beta) subunit (PCNA family)
LKAILDAKDFKRLIDNTKKFTRWDDGNNKLMQYIHIVVDAKSMEIKAEALDGHRISIEYGKLMEADESFSCFISPKIPVIVKGAQYAELELAEKKLLIRLGEFIVGCVQPEGKCFEVDELLADMQKTEPVRTIGLNATYLEDAMKAAKNTEDWQPVVEMDVREPDQPVIFRSGKRQNKQNLKVILTVNINH